MMKLTLIQFPTTSCEVHIWDAHKLGALSNLPDEVEEQEYGQADVSGDERINVPLAGQKHLESVEQNNEVDEKDAKVASVRLEGCLVRQRVSIDAVVREPFVEAHVCDQDDVPCDETSDRRDVHEPLEDGASIRADVHVCEESGER
jgi:hypothetical protein